MWTGLMIGRKQGLLALLLLQQSSEQYGGMEGVMFWMSFGQVRAYQCLCLPAKPKPLPLQPCSS